MRRATRQARAAIIDAVRRDGDAAVQALTEKFDAVRPASLQVTAQEFSAAERSLDAAQISGDRAGD
jgi:histidinol dehydrogenase